MDRYFVYRDATQEEHEETGKVYAPVGEYETLKESIPVAKETHGLIMNMCTKKNDINHRYYNPGKVWGCSGIKW